MDTPAVTLITPTTAEQLVLTREIFQEYADSLQIDLDFQGFGEELAGLPGDYAPPRGELFLAIVDGSVAGCCALRPIDDVDYANACEMKRLYVRKAFRGFGLGRLLVDATMGAAARLGYDCMLLDTLDSMESARALYADAGFEEIPPYYHNPIVGTHYLKADVKI
ncbi:MAG: GNAT family N-acetyltransferase [Comamonas sp.]